MEKIRLQKFLASNGIASRRKCEEYILAGKVSVNGQVVTELGTKIDPNKDKIMHNITRQLQVAPAHIYVLLNKPIGYVTTAKDQFNRPTVMELLKNVGRDFHTHPRLVPAGRLDMYTSGALILTNDGDFIYKVTHPKYEINKTYTVTLKGIVSNEEVEQLRRGTTIGIEEYTTRPAKVKILKTDEEKNISRLEITIHEGKNKQIRKMCEAIDKKVLALHRSKIETIDVKDLKIGEWRYLKEKEIKELLFPSKK